MSWSDWVYLAIGLGLGLGSHRLLRRNSSFDVSSPASVLASRQGRKPEPIVAAQEAEKETNQEARALLEKLHKTELSYQLAHEMSQFKAGFLVRISHELRSPLNSLIGFHQLILSDLCDNPAEEREFIAQANESALKLIKLLDEILDVARMEHGTSRLDIQPLQLAKMLEEFYRLTHTLAADRNFPLNLSSPDPEIYVLADPRCLRQVLVSLLDICIAQMESGSISVSAQQTAATGNHRETTASVYIWFDVSLPASAWSEQVDLMQSQEPIRNKDARSPGLKLLLAQNIVELMQGRLEVIESPTHADASSMTRIQLTIPATTAP